MNTYVVLLRGINVGGKNTVPMMGLKKCLEELGFANVSTYLASGNVIVQSDQRATEVKAQIEEALPEQAMAVFNPREGVDTVWPGDGVIYSQRLSSLRTKSRLSKIIGTPAYQSMTIRSWNTTTQLLKILEEIETRKEV
jgi:uncharacterized protein (DUF1697 family)